MPESPEVDLLENAADLTADDRLAEETVKDAPADDGDADLPEPDQDPNVVPTSAGHEVLR